LLLQLRIDFEHTLQPVLEIVFNGLVLSSTAVGASVLWHCFEIAQS
jgi:hypothetical protein